MRKTVLPVLAALAVTLSAGPAAALSGDDTARAAALTAGLIGASVARADEASEALYSRYHQAIEAAKQCRKLDFSDEAQARMGGVINAKIKHRIGAKRLSLLTAAQRDARALIKTQGCAGNEMSALLALFDRDLAPALPQ